MKRQRGSEQRRQKQKLRSFRKQPAAQSEQQTRPLLGGSRHHVAHADVDRHGQARPGVHHSNHP